MPTDGATPLQVKTVQQGVLDCFAAGLRDPKTQALVYCETSATLVQGQELVLASDKPVPGGSPVFSLPLPPWPSAPSPRPWMEAPFPGLAKLEAMATSPDGRYAFASTAFDRWDAHKPAWDAYNQLWVWPIGHTEQAQAFSADPGTEDTLPPLRALLQAHLQQPYFKIEGLAALPDQSLLLGVRELGRSYQDFSYKTLVLQIPYRRDPDGHWRLGPGCRTVLDFDPHGPLTQSQGLGLSSLEYDAKHDRVYVLTSHEDGPALGAYLWSMPRHALLNTPQARPRLVHEAGKGLPYHFTHKAEGLAVLPNGDLWVVHDDDRDLEGHPPRLPHQAVFTVLRPQDAP